MSQPDTIKSRATVYDALMSRIRRSIEAGELAPGAFIGSEHELVRESGISRISVRRATDELIRDGLIERRPGKGLFVRTRERSTATVQLIVPDLSFDQCVHIVHGAQAYGAQKGLATQVYDAHSKIDFDIEILRLLPESSAEGAIIVSWHHPRFAESLYELKRHNYPFVLVDEQLQEIQVPSVVADNYSGGYAVGKAVAEAGHQRVAFIGDMAADTVRARLEGVRDALTDAGILFDRHRVLDCNAPLDTNWTRVVSSLTRKAIERPDPATALVYSNDQTAAHGYVALRAMGLKVPRDVSVVGFDDNPLCVVLDPPLSSVRQPSMEMGRVAMEMLIDLMAHRHESSARHDEVRHVVLPTQWVGRDSIGRPKNT